MDTSLGKRKSPPGVGTDDSAVLFASVPDVCWTLVSSFAAPPDAYNLCLSSKRFFGTMGSDSDESDGEDSSDTTLLATRLLRSSLLASLARVLEHSESGISLEAVLALGEDLPEGSALIAGSTMVQASLGVLWERPCKWSSPPDVDIYASAAAAPSVRSWLVEQANCMFIGFNDGYIDLTDERLAYVVDSDIHHVESWGSVLENVKRNEDTGGGKGSGNDPGPLKETEYYKQAAEWGKDCHKTYGVDWKWREGMSFDLLGVEVDKSYDIKPKPGGDLPFDFEGYGNIDLIVARDSNDEGKITPSDLLNDFDLTICKCSLHS